MPALLADLTRKCLNPAIAQCPLPPDFFRCRSRKHIWIFLARGIGGPQQTSWTKVSPNSYSKLPQGSILETEALLLISGCSARPSLPKKPTHPRNKLKKPGFTTEGSPRLLDVTVQPGPTESPPRLGGGTSATVSAGKISQKASNARVSNA